MSRESTALADEFFDKQDVTTVDLEITFAALLGTAAITYSVENHVLLGQAAAFSLLLLTLIRRMAITSPFAPEDLVLSRTVPLISFASTSVIIYLLISLVSSLVGWISAEAQVIVFSGFTVGIVVISAIVQELVFRDYLAWWYVKFEEKRKQGNSLETVWRDTAILAYWASQARRHRESYRELGNRLKTDRPDLNDIDFNPREAGRYILAVSLVVGLVYLLPEIYALYVLGLPGLLVVPAVVAIHDHSAFFYIAYGNPSYEDIRRHVPTILIRTVLYVTEVVILFSLFEPPVLI